MRWAEGHIIVSLGSISLGPDSSVSHTEIELFQGSHYVMSLTLGPSERRGSSIGTFFKQVHVALF